MKTVLSNFYYNTKYLGKQVFRVYHRTVNMKTVLSNFS